MIKPNMLEKFSFSLARYIGSPLSLLLHTIVFGGFFILRYLGIVPNSILIVLTAAVSLEAIYLIIFTQMALKNNTSSLTQLQGNIEEIRQEENEVHKLMVNILHLAHQMKTLQEDFATLKKNGVLKASGNGHKIHHRV